MTRLYKAWYRRWSVPLRQRTPGYTLLLPVPADLPVFLQVALAVCGAQAPDYRVEAIVIPDQRSWSFERLFGALRSGWEGGPLTLARVGTLEALLNPHNKSPSTNHWLQLIRGINACRTTHALLHDADLFLCDRAFLKTHFESGRAGDYACFGVSDVWDDWYRNNGYEHTVATWELLFNLSWARNFKPWMHGGQDADINGKAHTFDTMLLPQCLTPANLVGQRPDEQGFVHFNYVISNYRSFRACRGPFEDNRFSLLLTRLLVHGYGMSWWPHPVPSLEELAAGLFDPRARVTYGAAETRANYPIFRRKLQDVLDARLLPSGGSDWIERAVDRFDHALG